MPTERWVLSFNSGACRSFARAHEPRVSNLSGKGVVCENVGVAPIGGALKGTAICVNVKTALVVGMQPRSVQTLVTPRSVLGSSGGCPPRMSTIRGVTIAAALLISVSASR